MKYRKFGNTDLSVSEIGFGAWGIGGPAMAGNIPIGWGKTDDKDSVAALKKAYDCGVNFFDTADFYGLGHSEELIGKTLSSKSDVIIATKVGHRISSDKSIFLDYSKKYILNACDESLRRLKRDFIDYYQLHSARIPHLENGECIEAMEKLFEEGKIRYWGISLNTFNPFPEAEFFMNNKVGHGFQLVFNLINQRALPLLKNANKNGYGIIARMPLQFGLLTGKFSKQATFNSDDHRNFRLTKEILETALDSLEDIWNIPVLQNTSKTNLSLSYILSFNEISSVIPGMKSVEQVIENTKTPLTISQEILDKIEYIFNQKLSSVVDIMKKQG
jgi:aryl-alcohol dehydrogenase-like predicted oxidoreductase